MDIANLARATELNREMNGLLNLGQLIDENPSDWTLRNLNGRVINLSRSMMTSIKRLTEDRILAIIEEVKNL